MQQTTQQISKISIADPKKFIDIFKFYNKCNDNPEIRLFFDRDKLRFTEMNTQNTLLTNIEISSSMFTEWDTEEGKKTLSISQLMPILRRVDPKKDFMKMEFNDTNYFITLLNSVKRQFTIPLIEIDTKEQKVPELSHSARIRVSSKTFNNILKEAKEGKIRLMAEKDAFKIEFLDYYEGKITEKTELKGNDLLQIEGKAISIFDLKLLKNAITSRLSEELVLNLGMDYPLRIDYLNDDKFKVNVVIAPLDIADNPMEETTKEEAAKPIKENAKPVKEIIEVEMTDKDYFKKPKKEVIKDDVGIDPRPVTAIIKGNKKSKEKPLKSKKIDLNDIGYSDSLGCPHCKEIIDIQHFSSKFTTPIGLIRDIVEEEHNSNIEFLEFALDNGIDDKINEDFEKMIKDKLNKYRKMFKGS